MSLPERINAIKIVTYATEHILADVALSNEVSEDEVTTEMLIDWLDDWIQEDLADGGPIILQDENGNEL